MCSQPPRNVQDGWIVEEILEAIPLIDADTTEITFTGGEPTLLGDDFLKLVQAMKSYLPRTSLHVLSNGRNFADEDLALRLAAIEHPDLMLGIPVYSDLSHLHDYVVQADGAFDETVRGILNLKRHGVKVEIRVVLHRHTVDRLPQLATYVARNLLFVDHVALMGLELMGFARANLDDLWVDPAGIRFNCGTLSAYWTGHGCGSQSTTVSFVCWTLRCIASPSVQSATGSKNTCLSAPAAALWRDAPDSSPRPNSDIPITSALLRKPLRASSSLRLLGWRASRERTASTRRRKWTLSQHAFEIARARIGRVCFTSRVTIAPDHLAPDCPSHLVWSVGASC
jgi:His-Xaa-Ser system radical SAM maturase HxsC